MARHIKIPIVFVVATLGGFASVRKAEYKHVIEAPEYARPAPAKIF